MLEQGLLTRGGVNKKRDGGGGGGGGKGALTQQADRTELTGETMGTSVRICLTGRERGRVGIRAAAPLTQVRHA